MNVRLPVRKGEWIDRRKLITFTFEGKPFQAYEGDTVTSALWAAGERILGRSFKYHRPRGVLSLANHDINVMVEDGVEINMRADVLPVQQGMQLRAVNTAGGVENDKFAMLGWLAPLLPAGFYYKAFHSPKFLFPLWENLIRKMAGLGVMNPQAPRRLSVKTNEHCDVLVVGAGPAGMMAAITAAKGGAQVILVDENAQMGGTFGYDNGGRDHVEALDALRNQISGLANIRVHLSSYAGGYYAGPLVPLVGPHGIKKVSASKIIVASGAYEQPAVFRNNDLPGVMLGSAAQRLMHRYGVKPFAKAVVLAGNDQAYRVMEDLFEAGVEVVAIVDLRADADTSSADQHGIQVYKGHCVLEAKGKKWLEGVSVCAWDGNGHTNSENGRDIACDGLVMCVGWAPAAALLYQSGARMRFDEGAQQFVPDQLPEGVFAAGRVNGLYGLEEAMADGQRAALAALGQSAMEVQAPTEGASYGWPIVEHPDGKNFIDFDEDLQLKDFANAAQESFDNIELMKRFTTVGMGPSQGKHSNMNAIRVLAKLRGEPIPKVGSTTARPFFHPVPLGHLAGRSFHPERHTPLHAWHAAQGATFTTVGVWQRPAYYGLEKKEAVAVEVKAVRTTAGLIDVGTLGKFEVRGPQAGELLERFYTGHFLKQRIGSTRYALLLDESGVIVDDGVVARFAEDHYYVTASTSNAAAVYRELTRRLQVWGLDATIVNLTGSYGALNIAGPLSQEILKSFTPADLTTLANGGAIETKVAGEPVRLINVRFVSELAYEIHAPAQSMEKIWLSLYETGKSVGLKPFGVDSQRLLRLEMGHFIVGQDTDGLTQPLEVGLNWALADDKAFYIGQRSLQIQAKKPLKKRLAGFILEQPPATLPDECCLVLKEGAIVGRLTSIAFSPTLNKAIGLAYVAAEDTAPGTRIKIRHQNGTDVVAIVAAMPFVEVAP